ncbi:MAG: hypothetical protein NVSMB9_05170 [Isosphaeraceae bacterium]
MPEPERETSPEQQAEAVALDLGRKVVGRELTVEEAEGMTTIFRSAFQALKHGFIRRLAEHVVAERTDESVEEFFEDVIRPD